MERILLDTKFWIHLKENPDKFKQFYTCVNGNDDIEVLFASPNFIDLIKSEQQDAIAKVVAHTADSYLPPLPDGGDRYPVTEDPLSLIPDLSFQQQLREETASYDEETTLRIMFRSSNFSAPDYDWGEELHRYRSIVDEYGLKYLMAIAFDDYLELGDDGIYHLDQSNIEIIEFLRKMSLVYRIGVLDPNEDPDPNDMNDLALCASAIVSECSVFAIEEKWVNVDIIGDMISDLLTDQDIEVVTEYSDLLPTIKNQIGSEDGDR
ncbi:hypothetical protein GJ633_08180 [Halorubrum sp. CBA1125]|nr:hypothetical protein [Halorubrum sp. CBA1125]